MKDTITLFDTINTTDTLIVNNYIHDTTIVENTITLFDTINTTDTLIVTNYDTITLTKFDTINTTDTLIVGNYIHDTTIVENTITLFDTINTIDTLIVTNYDTITKFDTITLTKFDTINTTDTLIVNNYIHDTTIVKDTITLFDTINTTDTLIITNYDTIILYDTITSIIYDTIIPCARVTTYIYATINENETYSGYGFTETGAGTYTNTFKMEDGCDSVVVLNLTAISGEEEPSEVIMYPNPTIENVYLSITNIPNAEILLIDIQGKILMKQKVLSDETDVTLDVKDLASGVYTIIVRNNKTKLEQKLIKD